MEWWGYLLAGGVVWLAGFIAGQGVGRSAALSQMMQLSVMKSAPGMPPGMPGMPGRG